MSSGIGLVLAGGGGKGAYHIGVWKALEELGISKNITAISGASVGALNGLLFANGSLPLAEHIWRTITPEKIIPASTQPSFIMNETLRDLYSKFIDKKKIVDNAYAIFSREGLNSIIDENINLKKVSKSDIRLFASALNCNTLNVEYLKMNNKTPDMIKKIVFASSALPVAYGSQEINGIKYLDGGLKDNVPVQPLLNLNLSMIIAVHLSKDSVNNKLYKNIIEIVPDKNQGGLFSGTLDFSAVGAKRRIEQGYEDTMNIMKPVIDIAEQQTKTIAVVRRMGQEETEFDLMHRDKGQQREDIKTRIKNRKEQLMQ